MHSLHFMDSEKVTSAMKGVQGRKSYIAKQKILRAEIIKYQTQLSRTIVQLAVFKGRDYHLADVHQVWPEGSGIK